MRSICHPDRPLKCTGLCKQCYKAWAERAISFKANRPNEYDLCAAIVQGWNAGKEFKRLEYITSPTKSCKICKTRKGKSEFPKDGSTLDGKLACCKDCVNEKFSSRYDCEDVREKILSWHKRVGKENQLRLKYNLTLDDLERMKLAQKGRCAICADVAELVVDHCHASGIVRQLLCNRCNSGLGFFRDNPKSLDDAAEYIRRWQKVANAS